MNVGAGVALAGSIVAGVGSGLVTLGGGVLVALGSTLNCAGQNQHNKQQIKERDKHGINTNCCVANVVAAVGAAACLNVAGLLSLAAGVRVDALVSVVGGGVCHLAGTGIK